MGGSITATHKYITIENYLLRFINSSKRESDVVIILEFAWKPLCSNHIGKLCR